MGQKIQNKTITDEDGAKLWVQRGWYEGRIVMSTDPGSDDVQTTVLLTKEQVRELIKFIKEED